MSKIHYVLIELKIEVPESEEFITDSFYEVEKTILDNFTVKEMITHETELEGSKEIKILIKNEFSKIMDSKEHDSCIKFPFSTQ